MTRKDTFKNTKLWQILDVRTDAISERIKTTLANDRVMPKIEVILTSGNSSPADFTLHDQDHAFRVAETMTKVVPQEVLEKLSTYELALLLLSAYLHDIGMAPQLKKVNDHYSYLLSGDGRLFSDAERQELRDWLDLQGERIDVPLAGGTPTTEELTLARYLVAHYVRSKHNDWSEDWIRSNLSKEPMGNYTTWLDDLVVLCRSHHEGYVELRHERFTPKLIGNQGDIVHLRYLACMLRMADVLEFDPERTPTVIFEHRDVSESSKVFWLKDHDLASQISSQEIIIDAHPAQAYLHKAVEETVKQVDEEMRLCRRLADETRFEKIVNHDDSYHVWNLQPQCKYRIEPRPGTYTYIDSAFRPNTKRLLELLSGIELYKEPLAAVREVLQNAFDAVRERIAYRWLEKGDPTAPHLEKELGSEVEVHLHFAAESGEYKLICTDQGTGMTKAIISNNLLVSASDPRRDLIRLERRCREANIPFRRTGQFGIGSLSYYMLAKKVSFTTRRSEDAGETEPTGWTFETYGINSFGELRANASARPGTQTVLYLKNDIVGDSPVAWFQKLKHYIRDVVTFCPCKFKLTTTLGEEGLACSYGWLKSEVDFNRSLEEIKEPDNVRRNGHPFVPPVLSKRAESELKQARQTQIEIYEAAKDAIRWKTSEGQLALGAVRYRISIPYFELAEGMSLAFLKFTVIEGIRFLTFVHDWKMAFLPRDRLSLSWKGIKTAGIIGSNSIPLSQHGVLSAVIEVDLATSESGAVSVDRKDVVINQETLTAIEDLRRLARDQLRELVETHAESPFKLLNHTLAEFPISNATNLKWVGRERDPGDTTQYFPAWLPLRLPEVHFSTAYSRKNHLFGLDYNNVKFEDKEVYYSSELSPTNLAAVTWRALVAPEKIVEFVFQNRLFLAALFTDKSFAPGFECALGTLTSFAPDWRNLVLAGLEGQPTSTRRIYINTNNIVYKFYSERLYQEHTKKFRVDLDPLDYKDFYLSSPSHCGTWLLNFLATSQSFFSPSTVEDFWTSLVERDKSFLATVWRNLGVDGEYLYMWWGPHQEGNLVVLSANAWKVIQHHDLDAIRRFLPEPSKAFQLSVSKISDAEQEDYE